jgi:hypothetical protein
MADKKLGVFFISALFSLFILCSIVSAALTVEETAISSMTVPEIDKPAIFELSITNTGASDTFTIYAISGIQIEPNESISIDQGDTEKVTIYVTPTIPLKISPDYYSFEYKIIGEKAGIQDEKLALTMVKLADAFDLSVEDTTMDSQSATVHLKNKYGDKIENISLSLDSELFSKETTVSLDAFEDKKISVPLEKSKIAGLLAGQYILSADIKVGSAEASKTAIVTFKEKEGITTSQTVEGFMLRRLEIEKKNDGNTKATVSIVVKQNIFSALFTRYNLPADKKDWKIFSVTSTFTKELSPNESLIVIAKTNWWILVLIIIIIGVIYYLIDKYIRNKIVLSKKVYFVRTKGGEFALKVSISVKARDFAERIRVLDRIPPMVKVFDRYGLSMPDKIDEKNRRLEWNIPALEKGEVRELSYIIYSKIGVVGRFELPPAEAFYEYMGKIKEARSNSAAYLNEPRASSD